MPAKKTKETASKAKNGSETAIVKAAPIEQALVVASAAQRRAQELIDLIERRKTTVTESFYEIGKALKELQQKKLYASLGHTSFEAMLRSRSLFGVTQAGKLIQIVSNVPLKTAMKLGPERAFALIRYSAATPGLDSPQVLIESGAKIGKVLAAEASVREIAEATRKARAKAPGKKVSPEVKEAERAAAQGRAWLKTRGVRGGRVDARRTKRGHRIVVDVPVEAAPLLFGAGPA